MIKPSREPILRGHHWNILTSTWEQFYRKKSSRQCDVFMHQWTRLPLFQIMARCMCGTRPWSEPMLVYQWLDTYVKRNLNQNIHIFIIGNAVTNVVCKMSLILYMPQCFKRSLTIINWNFTQLKSLPYLPRANELIINIWGFFQGSQFPPRACAAAGQSGLMAMYEAMFAQYGLKTAQVDWQEIINVFGLVLDLKLNSLSAKFFRGNIKHVFTINFITPHWYNTGTQNPSSSKTGTYIFYMINIMAADVLAMQGARASATMILT